MEPAQTLRFDYFRASIPAAPMEVIDGYRLALKGEVRSTKPLYGYTSAVGIHSAGDDPDLIVMTGDEMPLVQASGYPAQVAFEISRKLFPAYRPSRLDVAVDFPDPEWWDPMHSVMRELSHQRGAKHSIMGDWETPGSPDGRTVYSGSRTSVAYRRLYEFLKHHGYGSPVRYELEVKPKHKMRSHYSCMGPREILATDGYSVEFLRRMGVEISRMKISREIKGETDLERWFAHLVHQHGGKIMAYIAHALQGDVTEFGSVVARAIDEHRSSKLEAVAEAPR